MKYLKLGLITLMVGVMLIFSCSKEISVNPEKIETNNGTIESVKLEDSTFNSEKNGSATIALVGSSSNDVLITDITNAYSTSLIEASLLNNQNIQDLEVNLNSLYEPRLVTILDDEDRPLFFTYSVKVTNHISAYDSEIEDFVSSGSYLGEDESFLIDYHAITVDFLASVNLLSDLSQFEKDQLDFLIRMKYNIITTQYVNASIFGSGSNKWCPPWKVFKKILLCTSLSAVTAVVCYTGNIPVCIILVIASITCWATPAC